MACVDTAEMFVSIQGESTWAGLGCFFVRLAGCNLRCGYCDTPGALEAGRELIEIDTIVQDARASVVPLVEVTGGEPLAQESFPELVAALLTIPDKTVLVETNGSLDIGLIPEGAVAIVDVKCPGSGEGDSFDMANIARLRPSDEVKFVLSGREDYEWASDFVREHALVKRVVAVHFSPVEGALESATLGTWIVEDGLPVRVMMQLHKAVGMA